MATFDSIFPDGDGASPSGVETTGTLYYDQINTDPDTAPSTASYVNGTYNAATGDLWMSLGSFPSDFESMDDVTLRIYIVTSGTRTNDNVTLTTGITSADGGSTYLAGGTSSVGKYSESWDDGGEPTNQVITVIFNNTVAYVNTTADKATWDASWLHLHWAKSKVGGWDTNVIGVAAVEVTGTYTQAAPVTNIDAQPGSSTASVHKATFAGSVDFQGHQNLATLASATDQLIETTSTGTSKTVFAQPASAETSAAAASVSTVWSVDVQGQPGQGKTVVSAPTVSAVTVTNVDVAGQPASAEASASSATLSATVSIEVFAQPASLEAAATSHQVDTTTGVFVSARPAHAEATSSPVSVLAGVSVDVTAAPANVSAAAPGSTVDTTATVDVAAAPAHSETQASAAQVLTGTLAEVLARPAQAESSASSHVVDTTSLVDVAAQPAQAAAAASSAQVTGSFSAAVSSQPASVEASAPAGLVETGTLVSVYAQPAQVEAAASGVTVDTVQNVDIGSVPASAKAVTTPMRTRELGVRVTETEASATTFYLASSHPATFTNEVIAWRGWFDDMENISVDHKFVSASSTHRQLRLFTDLTVAVLTLRDDVGQNIVKTTKSLRDFTSGSFPFWLKVVYTRETSASFYWSDDQAERFGDVTNWYLIETVSDNGTYTTWGANGASHINTDSTGFAAANDFVALGAYWEYEATPLFDTSFGWLSAQELADGWPDHVNANDWLFDGTDTHDWEQVPIPVGGDAPPAAVRAAGPAAQVDTVQNVEVFQKPASSTASGTAAIVETTATVDVQAQPAQVESSTPACSVLTGTFVDLQARPAAVEAQAAPSQVDTVANVDIGGPIGQAEAAAPSQTVTAASGGPTSVDVSAAPGHVTTQLPGAGEYTYVFPRIEARPASVKASAPRSDAQGYAPNVLIDAQPAASRSVAPAEERGSNFYIVPLPASNKSSASAATVDAGTGVAAVVNAQPAQVVAVSSPETVTIVHPDAIIAATAAANTMTAPRYQVLSQLAGDVNVEPLPGRGRAVAPSVDVYAYNPDVDIRPQPIPAVSIMNVHGVGANSVPTPPSVVGVHGRLSSRVARETDGYRQGIRRGRVRFRGGR